MKFTIDTNKKMLSLQDDITFEELEALKKFIGKGWEKWQIAKTTEIVHQTHYREVDRWRPWHGYPYFGEWCSGLSSGTVYCSTADNQMNKQNMLALNTRNDQQLVAYNSVDNQAVFSLDAPASKIASMSVGQLAATN